MLRDVALRERSFSKAGLEIDVEDLPGNRTTGRILNDLYGFSPESSSKQPDHSW